MIEFTRDSFPFETPGAITVRLDGRPIGTIQPSENQKTAYVCSGIGLNSDGEGMVCGDIFRSAATLILRRLCADGRLPRGIALL